MDKKKMSKKQKYLDSVGKLQNQCAKDGITWEEFKKKFDELNGNPEPQSTTPPPGGGTPPPKP